LFVYLCVDLAPSRRRSSNGTGNRLAGYPVF